MIEQQDDRTPDTGATGQSDQDLSVLTAREAARLLGVNERTVRRAIARGHLRASKRSGVFRIQRDDLLGYRRRRRLAQPRQANRRQPLHLLPATPARPPFNVPAPRAPLIGREAELGTLRDLVTRADVPLVTLTGPGGTGKTRLALEVAAQVRDAYVDGTWFVDLSPLRDPELVPAAIAGVLGIREAAGVPPPDRLRGYLQQRHMLIVLDNVEQVVAAASDIADLLAACPGLTILATSRVPLRLADERRYPVAPLAVPDATHLSSVESIGAAPAVQLFRRKAEAVRPGFALTETNAHAVSAICTRLDGLPLAIELAAARTNVLAPEALLARLEHRLPLLTGGASDQPVRLRSMRDAIGWSYDLLDEAGQRLFRRLAVFLGGFSETAAFHVVDMDDATPMLDRLAALAESGLIAARDDGGDEARFAMLETIREFGLEQLEASGEADDTRARHAAWLLGLARRAEPYWFTADQKHWSETFEREHDNLRGALTWLTATGDHQAVARLTGDVWPFWFVRGHFAEGMSWQRQALAWTAGDQTVERVRVLIGSAALWLMRGDEPGAQVFNEEALSIARALGNLSPIEYPFNGLAICANVRGDYDEGERWNGEALVAFRALGDTVPRALPLVSVIRSNMGFVALERGDLERAARLGEEALAMQRDLGFSWAASDSLMLLARIAHERGEATKATRFYRESLGLAAEHQDGQQIIDHFDRYPGIDRDAGRFERAVMLLAAGSRLRELNGGSLSDRLRASLDEVAYDARAHLGEDRFDEAWHTGAMLSLDEAIAIALEVEVPPRPFRVSSRAARWGVTRRELDVLCLVAEGQTDLEIAGVLSISHRTVNTHVSRLLSKLGASSRREAMRLARSHGLLADCAVGGQLPTS